MAITYEKVDDLTLKVINTASTEEVYTLADLTEQKAQLVSEKEARTLGFNEQIAELDRKIKVIDDLTTQAIALGVKVAI